MRRSAGPLGTSERDSRSRELWKTLKADNTAVFHDTRTGMCIDREGVEKGRKETRGAKRVTRRKKFASVKNRNNAFSEDTFPRERYYVQRLDVQSRTRTETNTLREKGEHQRGETKRQ